MKTEVQLTELENENHVGFVDSESEKGYVACYCNKYMLLSIDDVADNCNGSWGDFDAETMQDAIEYQNSIFSIDKIYRFDTRKELYQWLAED